MDSSRVTLNAILGMTREIQFNKGWWGRRSCSPGDQRRVGANSFRWLWLSWIIWAQQVEHCEIESTSLVLNEESRGGCHCSHCVGETVLADKGNAAKEERGRDSGEGALAKNYFHVENTTTNRRILASVEQELQAAFRFEDGNGWQVN